MTVPHQCWHRPVACQSKTYAYYECRCGSRRSGLRTASRVVTHADTEWLAGADREPR